MQGRPEFVGQRERVKIRRVNEGVVTAGERRRYMLTICAEAISRGGKEKKKERSLHTFRLAIQWKQMYMTLVWRSVQRSKSCVTVTWGSSASLGASVRAAQYTLCHSVSPLYRKCVLFPFYMVIYIENVPHIHLSNVPFGVVLLCINAVSSHLHSLRVQHLCAACR